jgi:hypothetical protein
VIPLTRHLDPNLAALLAQFHVDVRTDPNGSSLVCEVVSLVDTAQARDALTAYHQERWRRPAGQAGPSGIRLSDLAELVGALILHAKGLHPAEAIYPLTFSSPALAAQPPGLDVVGVALSEAEVGPLEPDEYLSVAEAKSTLADNAANAISGIQQDVEKCTAERIADSLYVLKWEYERAAAPGHLRLQYLVAENSSVIGTILCDSHLCDVESTVASIFNRLTNRLTPTGALLELVLLFVLPDAADFIEATL